MSVKSFSSLQWEGREPGRLLSEHGACPADAGVATMCFPLLLAEIWVGKVGADNVCRPGWSCC